MPKVKNKKPYSSLSSNYKYFILFAFIVTFFFCIIKDPIVSADTLSYTWAQFYRFPGFVICINIFILIFGKADYGVFLVGFNLIIGFLAIYYTLKKFSEFLKLNIWAKTILFLVLLSPYFTSLLVANRLLSEGLAYPLYILCITFSVAFLFKGERSKIYLLAISFILLALTRGQFILLPFIVAFIYIIKHKKQVLTKPHIYFLIILFLLPVISSTLDKTYRKIAYNHFEKTPFSYVNAITLPLFVSKKEDVLLFKNKDEKNIFEMSYNRIDSLNLLSSKVEGSNFDKFWVYYNNIPEICNHNIHTQGSNYYINQGFTLSESYLLTEQSCKKMMPQLIKSNYKTYISLYYNNLIYGYKSVFIFVFFLIILLFSTYKVFINYNKIDVFLFFAASLIISNSFIVAVACHSKSRYVFYNYFLAFLITYLIFNRIKLKLKWP